MSFNTPVLFLVFNRPETTEKVFQRIREIQPGKLFIAADGPRQNKEGEKEKCEEVRKLILEGIDWPCEVNTLFRDSHLGCGLAVSQGISWFFSHVEEGIILEDDCLPDLSFFKYCETLLDRYRHEERIKMISGNNFQRGNWRGDGSYFFSGRCHIWGWATWKRTWEQYDFRLTKLDFKSFDQILRRYFKGKKEIEFWKKIYREVRERKVDSWAYPLSFSIWRSGGINIIPNMNLVTNIGFGETGTHLKDNQNIFSKIPLASISEIKDPSEIAVNEESDRFFFDQYIPDKRPLFIRVAKYFYRKVKKLRYPPGKLLF